MDILDRIIDKLTGNNSKRLENRIRITQLTKTLLSWKEEYSKLKPEFDTLQLEALALRDTNKELNKQLQDELAQRLLITSEYNTKLAQMQDSLKGLYSQIEYLNEAVHIKEAELKAQKQDPITESTPPISPDITSLSENELKFIKYLQTNPGSRHKDISTGLKINKTTVSNVLKGLVERGCLLHNKSRGTYNCTNIVCI